MLLKLQFYVFVILLKSLYDKKKFHHVRLKNEVKTNIFKESNAGIPAHRKNW